MPTQVETPPTNAVFRKLWRYSASQNIYLQIVKPLVIDLFEEDPTHKDIKNLLEVLVEIHKCLWNLKGPLPYAGATAGHFQELLYAFKHAEKDGRTVVLGHDGKPGQAGTGGDVSIYKDTGETKTIQMKVCSSTNLSAVKTHINKAGAQLTGQTGEVPPAGAKKVIHLVIQDSLAFDNYDADTWAFVIQSSLDRDYSSDHRTVTSADIKAAVQEVKVMTPNWQFKFKLDNGIVDRSVPGFDDEKKTNAKYAAMLNNRMHVHWNYLTTTWWNEAFPSPAASKAVIEKTKEVGIKGSDGAYPGLPMWR